MIHYTSTEASLQDLKDNGNSCCLRACINLLEAGGFKVEEIPTGCTSVFHIEEGGCRMTCRNGSHYECDKCSIKNSCEDRCANLLQRLADLVIEWATADDDVAEHGWNNDNESKWDNAKNGMVGLAYEAKELFK